jgi:hypothetical protein
LSSNYYVTSIILFFVLLILISLLITYLAYRIIAPIDRLVEATKKIVANVGG